MLMILIEPGTKAVNPKSNLYKVSTVEVVIWFDIFYKNLMNGSKFVLTRYLTCE